MQGAGLGGQGSGGGRGGGREKSQKQQEKGGEMKPNFRTAGRERTRWRVPELNPNTPGPAASADKNCNNNTSSSNNNSI